MAACGGLEHIFEKPLPPWKSIDHHHHSFTEIFGQKDNNYLLHHSLQSPTSLSSSLSSNSDFPNGIDHQKQKQHKRNDSFSSMNSECISTCTEELGFDDVDHDFLKNEIYYTNNWKPKKTADYQKYWGESKRYSRKNFGALPPPISCLGRNGKPWVFFKSIRKDGRFILKEIRIPTQEFLHACRKNGRLKMQFIHSDDEILDEDEDEEEEEHVDRNYVEISETEDDAGDIQVTRA